MMDTTVRIDGCADMMNKKPDFIIKNTKYQKIYRSQNLTRDRSDDCKTQ